MKSLPPRIDEAAQKKGIANLTRALIGRRSRRDDVAYGGTPMPQPVAEARQGHFESVNTTDLKPDDIVIAVMGPTGSGRSTFICSASGRDTGGIGHTLKSYTDKVSAIRFWDQASGRSVVLVDTPGFDDTSKSDFEILNMISDWLVSSYNNKKLLSAILYFHRITDNRMAGTPLKNLRVFRKLCGKDALDSVYLTTTMWDEVEPGVGEKRLDQLRTEYWKTMINQGAQIARCRSDDDSAKKLLGRVIARESPLKALLIQEEMVKLKKELRETDAGQQLYSQPQVETLVTYGGTSMSQPAAEVGQGPFKAVSTIDLKPDDVVIAVMGPTGSGRSTFIRSASGRDTIGIGHTLKSYTDKVSAIRFWDQASGRSVVLVDTPGFDDTSKSDFEILNMISDWLVSSYNNKKLLSAILYFHRITDNRMAGTPLKNLRVFRKLCGKDALDSVYLTTTMWDEVEPGVGEKRLDQLMTEYWKTMIDQGAHVARCRSDDDSANRLIRHIIHRERSKGNSFARGGMPTPQPSAKASHLHPLDAEQQPQTDKGPAQTDPAREIAETTLNVNVNADDIVGTTMGPTGSAQENPLKVLLIQEEMVELKKELKATAAGQQVYSQLEILVEKQMALLRRIDRERKATSDADILKELQNEYNELRAQIDDKLGQMQELKSSRFKRFFIRRRD